MPYAYPMKKEQRRLQKMMHYENEAHLKGYKLVAGVDEAGRGPLAGPVVAAACILGEGVFIEGVNDSKQLTAEKRDQLFHTITNHPQITYAVGIVDEKEIDKINILQATFKAMRIAVAGLKTPPDFLLIDGHMALTGSAPSQSIVKGDSLSQSIAAASIIAKYTRDVMMVEFGKKWSVYGFEKHKGYATEEHLEAIRTHGPCDIHRMSFSPMRIDPQLEFNFS